MARIVFENMGRYGIIKDRLAHTLPLEAWSDGANIRFWEGAVQRVLGHTSIWTPVVDPWWMMPVITETQAFWVYAGQTKVYAVDQAGTHADISRTSGGAYNAGFQTNWTGTIVNGIPVFNNGSDVPQMWLNPALGTPLVALTAWPAGYSTRILRTLREFMVALDLTEGGVRYPYNVLWSHPALPGTVPSTWNVADQTKDAGEKPLADEGGIIIDFLPLKDVGIIYRETKTHGMQYVGGSSVFRLWPIHTLSGIFSKHCVVPLAIERHSERHFVMTHEDVLVHDGQTAESVIDLRMRRWLFQQIDETNYRRTHVAANPGKNEVWINIPSATGQCTRALIWNYKEDKWTIRDLPSPNWVASGILSPAASQIWNADDTPWASDQTAWDDPPYPPQSKRILMGTNGAGRKLLLADASNQLNGVDFSAFVERVGLAIVAQDKEGNPKFDLEVRKLCTEIWPRIDAPPGAKIDIYAGTQEEVNDSVRWNGPFPFIVGTDLKVTPLVSGRLLGVKFVMSGNYFCRLHGFDMEIQSLGKY